MKITKLIETLQKIYDKTEVDLDVLIGRDFCPGAEIEVHHFPDSPVPDSPVYLVEVYDEFSLRPVCTHQQLFGFYGRCLVNTCWNHKDKHNGNTHCGHPPMSGGKCSYRACNNYYLKKD